PYVTTNQPSGQLFYLLKPDPVFKKYISKEADGFAKLGVGGIHLDYMGDTVYSDQDNDSLTSRQFTIDTWVKTMDLMREKVGFTSVDYGNAYALGHVDRIDNIPLHSSDFIYSDESIPFYQIVIHGLVPYTGDPFNLSDDPREALLRHLEYGAMPSFELTHENSEALKRTMVDYLFSSRYEQWLEESVGIYEEAKAVLGQVSDQMIINHEQLDEYVFRTTYENGLQVIVNYDSKPANVDGVVVGAYDYVVREGRG